MKKIIDYIKVKITIAREKLWPERMSHEQKIDLLILAHVIGNISQDQADILEVWCMKSGNSVKLYNKIKEYEEKIKKAKESLNIAGTLIKKDFKSKNVVNLK